MNSERVPPIRIKKGKAITFIGDGSASLRVSDSDVLKWFSDAALGRRVRVPDVEFCNDISKRLNSIIDIGIPGEAIDFLGVSRKYAGLFLRHIPRAREIISEVHGGRGQREEILDAMDSSVAAVSRLLSLCNLQIPKHSWHVYVDVFRPLIQDAWGTAGKIPRSTMPDQPLCRVLVSILRVLGHSTSAESVSEALRARVGVGVKRGTRSAS